MADIIDLAPMSVLLLPLVKLCAENAPTTVLFRALDHAWNVPATPVTAVVEAMVKVVASGTVATV